MAQTVWLPTGNPLIIPGIYGPVSVPYKDRPSNKEFYARQLNSMRNGFTSWTFYYDQTEMDEEVFAGPNITIFSETRGNFYQTRMVMVSGWVSDG